MESRRAVSSLTVVLRPTRHPVSPKPRLAPRLTWGAVGPASCAVGLGLPCPRRPGVSTGSSVWRRGGQTQQPWVPIGHCVSVTDVLDYKANWSVPLEKTKPCPPAMTCGLHHASAFLGGVAPAPWSPALGRENWTVAPPLCVWRLPEHVPRRPNSGSPPASTRTKSPQSWAALGTRLTGRALHRLGPGVARPL